MKISSSFNSLANCIIYPGDCLELLKGVPDQFVKLVVTSPPYNLGKPYETRLNLSEYLNEQL